jgi:serine/threonine-protein kinase OSR1/STK39
MCVFSVEKLVEEVQRRKDINSQLEQQISSLISSNNIS